MYMDKSLPLVSVIIVNYNGRNFVSNCIESILKNNYNNYEIIVVDNASSDNTVSFIKRKFSNQSKLIKTLVLKKNFGPAKARNEGVNIANGKYIGFLDNDTEVDPNWIIEAIKEFEKDKKFGIIQCKLLLLKDPNRIDYAGEYIGQTGFLVHRAGFHEIDVGQYNQNVEILAAKSAGMFIRKEAFEKIGGFDDDYFIFVEETDLGWRSWLMGYKSIFCSTSIVYHLFSTTKDIVDKNSNNYLVRFHGTKNYIMTLIKNLGFRQLIYTLPIHGMIWLGLSSFLIIRGNYRSGFNILRGIWWNLVNLPKILNKRWYIQSRRVISDEILFKKIMKKQKILSKVRQFLVAQKTIKTPENM